MTYLIGLSLITCLVSGTEEHNLQAQSGCVRVQGLPLSAPQGQRDAE